MKFTKMDNTGIRKAKLDDGTVYAIIGQVRELLVNGVIYVDNTTGNEDKWLGIEANGDVVREFNSLEEAKDYYRIGYYYSKN